MDSLLLTTVGLLLLSAISAQADTYSVITSYQGTSCADISTVTLSPAGACISASYGKFTFKQQCQSSDEGTQVVTNVYQSSNCTNLAQSNTYPIGCRNQQIATCTEDLSSYSSGFAYFAFASSDITQCSATSNTILAVPVNVCSSFLKVLQCEPHGAARIAIYTYDGCGTLGRDVAYYHVSDGDCVPEEVVRQLRGSPDSASIHCADLQGLFSRSNLPRPKKNTRNLIVTIVPAACVAVAVLIGVAIFYIKNRHKEYEAL